MIQIPLAGTVWSIKEVEMSDDGQCSFDHEQILVNENRNKHRKGVILTHELLHIIFDSVGVDEDEALVRKLEHGVYSLIRNFPEEYK